MIITTDLIIGLHRDIMDSTDGIVSIRDRNLLDSSVGNIYQTFDGKDLYKTEVQKIARLTFSIITSHPFIDGNKRVGMYSLIVFLRLHGYLFTPSQQEVVTFGFGIADGSIDFKTFLLWVENNT